MAARTHRIRSYNYSFDARGGGPGGLQLWGSAGLVLDVGFVDDQHPVPAPIISPDLGSAKVSFRCESLPGLIDLLRSSSSPAVVIDDLGTARVVTVHGLADSVVVCTPCAPDLLKAKTTGIREAMRGLVDVCGADALPEVCPVTFHLAGDTVCGSYQSGTTGHFTRDASGLGHVCLFDVEKENRALPFTVENAVTPQDQLLPVHEAMHAWFQGRQHTYRVQEPFCKLVSFIVSLAPGGPDYSSWFAGTPDDHPDALMKHLCQLVSTTQQLIPVLARTARAAEATGEALSDTEFADVVTETLGQDARPAFRAAGILP